MYYLRPSSAQKALFDQTQQRLFSSLAHLFYCINSLENDSRQKQIQQKLQSLGNKPASPLLYSLNNLLASGDASNLNFCIKAFLETDFSNASLVEDTAELRSNGHAESLIEKGIGLSLSDTKPLDNQSKLTNKISRAIQTIHHYAPLMGCEVHNLAQKIYVTTSPKMISGTSFNLFGAIYIGESILKESDIILCTSIIHEVAHLYFYALSTIDPLILNDYDERYTSPLKVDPRPLIAVFHAVFVLSRMVNFTKQILKYPKSPLYQEALIEYHKNLDLFEAGYKTVHENAKLTTLGKKFLTEIRKRTS